MRNHASSAFRASVLTVSGTIGIILTLMALLMGLLFSQEDAQAAPPPTTMNFQGRLANSSNILVADGLYNMQFRIFTVASGGSAVWTETRETTNRVQVTNGLFSVQLGAVTPLSASVFNATDLYFEITMATPATATCSTASCASWESPMTPRNKLATSAYAYNAATLNGFDETDFAAASGSNSYIQNTTTPQTANFSITGNGTANIFRATTFDRATSGTLTVGGTNATAITLADNTSVTGTLSVSSTISASNLSGTNTGNVTLSGQNYLSIAGQTITAGAINLSGTHVTATLGLGNGGTGSTTAQGAINNISGLTTNGDLLYHNGTNSTRLARGTTGQCLTSNATTLQWGSCGAAGASTSLNNLTATSINQSLIANANNTLDLGSSSIGWRSGYFGTAVYAPLLDRANAGALSIGTSNATSINIGTNAAVAQVLTAGSTNTGATSTLRAGASSVGVSNNGIALQTGAANASAFSVKDDFGNDTITIDTSSTNGNLVSNPGADQNTTGWVARTSTTMTRNTNLANVYYGTGSISAATSAATNAGVNYPIQLAPNTDYTIYMTAKATVSGDIVLGYAADGSTETTYIGNKTIGTNWTNLQVGFTTPATVNGSAYIFIKQSVATAKTIYIDGLTATLSTNSNYYRENLIKLGSSSNPVVVGAVPGDDVQPQSAMYIQQSLNNSRGLTVQGATGFDLFTRDIFAVNAASGTNIFRVNQNVGNYVDIQGGSGFWNRSALSVTTIESGAVGLRVQGTSGQSADLLQLRNSGGTVLSSFNASGSLQAGTANTIDVGSSSVALRSGYFGTSLSSPAIRPAADGTTAFRLQNAAGTADFLTLDTTNNRLTIGTADTTGVLLVLDTKTSSGDPTGVNGGMYYNSSSSKFRCYEGGAWKDCVPATTKHVQLLVGERFLGHTAEVEYEGAATTDLTQYSQVRFSYGVSTPQTSVCDPSGSLIAYITYDADGVWPAFGGSTLTSNTSSSEGNLVDSWVDIPAGAKADSVRLGYHFICTNTQFTDIWNVTTKDITVEFR